MASPQIIVVEDERIVALHLQQQLKKLGYAVPAIAAAGDVALRTIGELRPDLVLMDIHIEGPMDGIETASRIPAEWQIPVMYLTAYSEEATLERARATKPYGYLLKPFSERELHAAIQMTLERRRADMALRRAEEELRRINEELEQRVAREVAEREAVQLQAQKLHAIGQLTGGIAHDFNNLLMAISGNLGLIAEQSTAEAAVRPLVETAQRAAARGARLVAQLPAFARRQVLRPEIVDINDLVRDSQLLIARALGEAITIEFLPTDDLGRAEADPAQLQMAILNLILNARDAMPRGGELTIETRNVELDAAAAARIPEMKPGAYVVLTVTDSGTGMSPDVAARAFEPFFTTKEVGRGSGLGLSQVYGFARQSGGSATIESEVGRGTVVRIYLPRSEEDAPSRPAPLAAEALRGRGETILVVEDDDTVRPTVISMLAALGYRPIAASSGAAALAIIERGEPIDLLFSDIVMPGGVNGLRLARAARECRPGLRVLLTTGHFEFRSSEEIEGAQDFPLLAKPYLQPDLGARLRQILAS